MIDDESAKKEGAEGTPRSSSPGGVKTAEEVGWDFRRGGGGANAGWQGGGKEDRTGSLEGKLDLFFSCS
jgi:hypothetical protein